jgi:hypothetical protein
MGTLLDLVSSESMNILGLDSLIRRFYGEMESRKTVTLKALHRYLLPYRINLPRLKGFNPFTFWEFFFFVVQDQWD